MARRTGGWLGLFASAALAVCAGGAPAGGAGAAAGTPRRPVCGGGSPYSGASHSCADAGKLTLSDPTSRNARGGKVGPGDTVVLAVRLTNSTGRGFAYPCVGFAADTPGVAFSGPNPVFPGGYAIGPGETSTFEINAQLSPSIAPGTVVRVTAWVDSLHAGCTNGATLAWTIKL
jgi:hypothetical protein